jgi:hypothetical protein
MTATVTRAELAHNHEILNAHEATLHAQLVNFGAS